MHTPYFLRIKAMKSKTRFKNLMIGMLLFIMALILIFIESEDMTASVFLIIMGLTAITSKQ